MTVFDGKEFVYGYPADELLLFALACREAGITNEDLHRIAFNIEWAVDAVKKQTEKAVRESFEDWINAVSIKKK